MTDQPDFDEAYYKRFYGYPHGREADRREFALMGEFVCSYMRYLRLPVRRVLDIGCGLGYWKDNIAEHYPTARYVGVEYSPFLCEKFGWIRGSVVDFKTRGFFDLVMCNDVLQYLSNADARTAIDNLARQCRGALFINALTREDWDDHCDRQASDGDVFMRKADWYRRQLAKHFVNAGGCLFVKRGAPA